MPRSTVLFSSGEPVAPEPELKAPTTSESSAHRQRVYKLISDLTHTPFSPLVAAPKVFSFSDQTEDEKIILVVRQHWFVNLKWIGMAILMFLAPVILRFIPIFDFVPLKYLPISYLFWYLLTFAFAFEGFLSWWFNVFVITEERVVDIDFINLLNSKVSDAQIDKIQDVSYEVKGIAATFLNFGTIVIQTAGEIPEIEVPNAPSPDVIAKVLQGLRLEEQQEALEGRLK
jgi:hypothetical protein